MKNNPFTISQKNILVICIGFFFLCHINFIDSSPMYFNFKITFLQKNEIRDTTKLSNLDNVLKIKTFNTYPQLINSNTLRTSEKVGEYYLTIKPKYKFGDFSLIVSENGNAVEGYSTMEVQNSQFVTWTVKRDFSSEADMLIVPDNKPLKDLDVAFNGFYLYFPHQYLKPLLDKKELYFDITGEGYQGEMYFSVEEYASYQLEIDGEEKNIPCIKIKRKTKVKYPKGIGFFEKTGNTIHETIEKTYWILNNLKDPLILKEEGFRIKEEEKSKSISNGFKRIEDIEVVSISTK